MYLETDQARLVVAGSGPHAMAEGESLELGVLSTNSYQHRRTEAVQFRGASQLCPNFKEQRKKKEGKSRPISPSISNIHDTN